MEKVEKIAIKTEEVGGYQWVVFGVVTAIQVFRALVNHGLPPLLPLLRTELGLSLTQVGGFMSVISAGQGIASVPAGWLVDKVGIRKTMPIAEFFVGLSLASLALAWNFESAIPALVVAGMASSIVNPASVTAIYTWLPTRARGTAMGVNKSGVTFTGIVAAAILPSLALAIGWQKVAILMGITNVACALLALSLYRDRPAAAGEREGIGRFWGVFYNPYILLIILYAGTLGTIQTGLETFFMLYLKDTLLVSVVLAGGYLAVIQTGGFVGRMGWGAISDWIFKGERKRVLVLISITATIALIALAAIPSSIPPWLLVILAFALGASNMGFHGVYLAYVTEVAGPGVAGTAVGFSAGLIQVFRIVTLPLLGYVADSTGSYRLGWMACGIAAGLMTVVTMAFLREPQSKTSD